MVFTFATKNNIQQHVVHASDLIHAMMLLNNFKIDITKLKLI